MIKMHGIKNCDTIKKARKTLQENNIEYEFRDFKKDPADINEIKQWLKTVDWQVLLNKRGTSWRKLSTEQQQAITDADSAAKALAENNSMIKRPLMDLGGSKFVVGVDGVLGGSE